jgi:hypothetical protein
MASLLSIPVLHVVLYCMGLSDRILEPKGWKMDDNNRYGKENIGSGRRCFR